MITYIDVQIPNTKLQVSTVFDAVEEKNMIPPAFTSGEEMRTLFTDVLNLHTVAYLQGEDENVLIVPLLDKLFILEEHIEPEDVGLLIVIDDALNRGNRMTNLGQYIQQRYELENTDVMVLSGNHCSNFEYALWYADKIANSSEPTNVVVLGLNKLMKHEERVISSYAVMGDGAAVCVVRPDSAENGIAKIVNKYSVTNGEMYEAAMNNENMFVLYKYYLKTLTGLLKKSGIPATDFEHILIQNANHMVIEECAINVGFSPDQIFRDNLSRHGHLDCVDFVLNLGDVIAKSEPGTRLFSFGTGWAGSFISLHLETL